MHSARSALPLAVWGKLLSALSWVLITPSLGSAQDGVDSAMESLGARGPSAVAIVHCGSARAGTAFSFGAPDQLITAWHVADCPRALSVELLDGQRFDARVSARDSEQDLAVLVADGVALTPLSASETTPAVGLRVFALGFDAGVTERALLVSPGTVGGATSELVRCDVRHGEGSVGGPLLDTRQRVVAVIVGMDYDGVTRAIPIARLASLEQSADDPGDVRSPVRLGVGVGFEVWAHRDSALVGGSLALDVEILDQLVLRGAIGAAAGERREPTPSPYERSDLRVGGSLAIGYRFRIELGEGAALTLEPYIGLWGGYSRISETSYALGFSDPTCNPSAGPCSLMTSGSETLLESWSLRPTLGLRVRLLDALDVGYEVQLDLERPEESVHVFTFGFGLGGISL